LEGLFAEGSVDFDFTLEDLDELCGGCWSELDPLLSERHSNDDAVEYLLNAASPILQNVPILRRISFNMDR
jgi:hypothetical protein